MTQMQMKKPRLNVKLKEEKSLIIVTSSHDERNLEKEHISDINLKQQK